MQIKAFISALYDYFDFISKSFIIFVKRQSVYLFG